MMEPPKPRPLLITLQLDAASFERFNGLRQRHFPPERNFLPAHITLFHALPGGEQALIQQVMRRLSGAQSVLPLNFVKPWFLGGGVAIEVESPELVRLRAELVQQWPQWLTAQDRQSYRPHITVQNKVPAAQARTLFAQFEQTWTPVEGQGTGLLLWRYDGGPWTLIEAMPFE